MQRHDLIFVRPAAWRSLVAARGDLAAQPLAAGWADAGWPLVVRRPLPGEGRGVPLGLPLPPFAGKQRLSVLMAPEDVLSTAPPPALAAVIPATPRAWWPTLERIGGLVSRHAVEARVFGSLAWRALTGLDYLTDRSDLDLLLAVRDETDLDRLTADLSGIEAVAPMRLDGELVRDDGAAVNWRELHAGAGEILVKTLAGVALLDAGLFHRERVPS